MVVICYSVSGRSRDFIAVLNRETESTGPHLVHDHQHWAASPAVKRCPINERAYPD